MKAKIVDLAELKKKPQEREAEQFLNQLGPDKAIEVTLTGEETPRKVSRLYRKAATRLGKEVRVISKEGKIFVTLK